MIIITAYNCMTWKWDNWQKHKTQGDQHKPCSVSLSLGLSRITDIMRCCAFADSRFGILYSTALIRLIVSRRSELSNGGPPTSIVYSTEPSENMSVARPCPEPLATSLQSHQISNSSFFISPHWGQSLFDACRPVTPPTCTNSACPSLYGLVQWVQAKVREQTHTMQCIAQALYPGPAECSHNIRWCPSKG